MKELLVGGEGFAIGATVIEADANRTRRTARGGLGTCAIRGTRHGPYASVWSHSGRYCADSAQWPSAAAATSRQHGPCGVQPVQCPARSRAPTARRNVRAFARANLFTFPQPKCGSART